MAWQWAETLVEIRGTLADIRGTTKYGIRYHFPKHEFNRPVCSEVHHYLLANFHSSGFHHICNIKCRLDCRYSPPNIFNAKKINPHKKPISLLNVPICTHGMQRTCLPEADTSLSLDRINNIASFVQIMVWRRSGHKPLSELMMVSLLMHICVTRPQWVNTVTSHWGHWWRPLQPTSSITTDAKSVDSNLVDFDRKTCLDQPGIFHDNSS